MKIAVTYDNGNIFQHFGKTENFKVYEVEDNKVVSSEVIGSNGTGHGALAGLLSEQGVDVLICGGIGGGEALVAGQTAEHQRTNTVRIAEGVQCLLVDKRHGVAAANELHRLADTLAQVMRLLREVADELDCDLGVGI